MISYIAALNNSKSLKATTQNEDLTESINGHQKYIRL